MGLIGVIPLYKDRVLIANPVALCRVSCRRHLGTGMIYALLGIGLSLILGLLNIPNFAQGALYALGGYFLFSLGQVTFAAGAGLAGLAGALIAPVQGLHPSMGIAILPFAFVVVVVGASAAFLAPF